MFLHFYLLLRQHGIPVSFGEYLSLLQAVQASLHNYSAEEFYYLSRTALVKHEQHLDKFDQLFGKYFKNMQLVPDALFTEVPAEWLQRTFVRNLTDEEKAAIEGMGGWDALVQRFQDLLQNQDGRHQGGNTYIGTGGTSPYGNSGFNVEGFQLGDGGGQRTGIKAWDMRRFRGLQDDIELGTRNIKMALRKLRLLTREGRDEELDLDDTIERTSRNAGVLEIAMQPSRQNRIKVLLLLDVGGSMDAYARVSSELFTAAKHEFKRLEIYYFHNCIYDHLWRDSHMTRRQEVPTLEVLHKYNKDYKVVVVGDAAMNPYELLVRGGTLSHMSYDSGADWLLQFIQQYPALVWLNPEPAQYWMSTHTIKLIYKMLEGRMFPLTVQGLGHAIKHLKKPRLRPDDWMATG